MERILPMATLLSIALAAGDHGSPALEPGSTGEAEYWSAVRTFLASLR